MSATRELPIDDDEIDLVACRLCGLPHQVPSLHDGEQASCVRCGSSLARAHANAGARTAALTLAALLLYAPANVFSILHLERNGARSDATVMGSVRLLAEGGDYFVAAVVFLASIVIPPVKLLGLFYLGVAAHFGWTGHRRFRTRLYHVIEMIGKWAMLDVFVLAVMVAAVKLSTLATITAGPGVYPFTIVVVLTLAATEGFDPRAVWQGKRTVDVTEATTDGQRTRRALPRATVGRRRWTASLIWLVPLASLLLTTHYFRLWYGERGPTIVVRAVDANSFEPGNTPVRSRGVEIGIVTDVTLTRDLGGASVRVRLRRDAAAFARDGAQYWVVKPQLTGGSISGLGTFLSGAYLEAMPPEREGGAMRAEFTARDGPPAATSDALPVRLVTPRLDHVQRGTPIYYRGIAVGSVESFELGRDATHVVVRGTIQARYAPLVRADSKFWADAPADVRGGLLSGLKVEVGSLRQLLAGRINFSSPDSPLAPAAAPDALFQLANEPDPAWLKWNPQIAIEPGAATREAESTATPQR